MWELAWISLRESAFHQLGLSPCYKYVNVWAQNERVLTFEKSQIGQHELFIRYQLSLIAWSYACMSLLCMSCMAGLYYAEYYQLLKAVLTSDNFIGVAVCCRLADICTHLHLHCLANYSLLHRPDRGTSLDSLVSLEQALPLTCIVLSLTLTHRACNKAGWGRALWQHAL